MMFTLRREYRFEAAHQLTKVPEGHKCGRMHGHSYCVAVILKGADLTGGWLLDFAEVDEIAGPTIRGLDHRCLNDVIDNPTSERIALWLHEAIAPRLPWGLVWIEVSETERSSVTYGPE